MITLAGIGSPHGADRVGWAVIDHLKPHLEPRMRCVKCGIPLEIIDYLTDCDRLFLFDACQTGAVAGTVFRWVWPSDRIRTHQSISSHGLGLADVLLLADQLGRLPPTVILYGLEVDMSEPQGSGPVDGTPGLDDLLNQFLAENTH